MISFFDLSLKFFIYVIIFWIDISIAVCEININQDSCYIVSAFVMFLKSFKIQLKFM